MSRRELLPHDEQLDARAFLKKSIEDGTHSLSKMSCAELEMLADRLTNALNLVSTSNPKKRAF